MTDLLKWWEDFHVDDPLAVLGLLLVVSLLYGMYRAGQSDENTYRLSDFISTGGHFDLAKLGQLVALITTTWVIVHMEKRSATVEWALTLYGLLWAGAQFGSLWARIKSTSAQSSSSVETTVVAKSTEVKLPEIKP
jgi:hypothetical protein